VPVLFKSAVGDLTAWSRGRGKGREKLVMLAVLPLGCPSYRDRFGMNGDDLVTVVVLDESESSLEIDWALDLARPASPDCVFGEPTADLLGDGIMV
jgi:hypothetical protein